MPLNIVQVSSTEQAAIRRALQIFLTAHPEFKNQLHGIKITRKKYDVGLDEKIRKVFFPTLDNHGNRIINAFNCPMDSLDDTQPTNGHSCTLIQQHGMLKMVYPQNRMEQNSLEYYKDVNLNRGLTITKIKVKHAAVYDYQTKKKETEIIYKSNFPYKTSSVLEDSTDPTIIQRYQDIYWSKSLKKSYNATNSQTDKTIQFMFHAGKNIKINPLMWESLETIAWKMLIALAELQAAGLIHGDIKPENICYKKHPCIKSTEAAIIRIIDFESLQTITNSVPFTLFTPGYIAPELFQSNQPQLRISPNEFKSFF